MGLVPGHGEGDFALVDAAGQVHLGAGSGCNAADAAVGGLDIGAVYGPLVDAVLDLRVLVQRRYDAARTGRLDIQFAPVDASLHQVGFRALRISDADDAADREAGAAVLGIDRIDGCQFTMVGAILDRGALRVGSDGTHDTAHRITGVLSAAVEVQFRLGGAVLDNGFDRIAGDTAGSAEPGDMG